MRRLIYIITILLSFQLFNLTGQAGNCDPDSLKEITVSGIISIENTGSNAKYYLETDSATYILNFGPWWYQPSTGEAVKPEDGNSVLIFGGLNSTNPGIYPVIVVYEIDGLFWRNPYDPFWNHFNDEFSSDPETFGQGIGCGWPDSNVSTEMFSGIVMIDTTMVFYHYFLDTDMDGLPDYRLNFGPPWYDPPGDVTFPEEGEFVTVEGGIVHITVYPVIIVFTINGEIWRDDTGFGSGNIGKWMHGNQNANVTILSPFDTLNQIHFQNGWHHGGLPGSMYCQMIELHHQNLFQHQEHQAFAGFEIACFNQNREKYMNGSQYQNGMMFNNQLRFQFHYTQYQMDRYRFKNKDRIRLHYWDRQAERWVEESGIEVDTINHIVTFYTQSLQAYYLLSSEITTGLNTPVTTTDNWFMVRPNPADQGLTVDFTGVIDNAEISLIDAKGGTVSTYRLNGITKGNSFYLSTSGISAGLYYLRISFGNMVEGLPVVIQR